MKPKDLLAGQLHSATWLVEQALQDFTDAEARAQAPGNGVHVIWTLMHTAVSEDLMVSKLTGGQPQIPAEVVAKYRGGTQADPRDSMTKEAAMKVYNTTRQRTITALANTGEADWDKPAPEGFPPMFKTAGDVWGLQPTHAYWHFGQITLIRRMLGKPSFLGM